MLTPSFPTRRSSALSCSRKLDSWRIVIGSSLHSFGLRNAEFGKSIVDGFEIVAIVDLTPVDAAVCVDGFRNIFPGALQRVNEGADRRHEHFSSISGLVVERVGHGMASHGMSEDRKSTRLHSSH